MYPVLVMATISSGFALHKTTRDSMPNAENVSLAIHCDSQIITGCFPRCLLTVYTALFSCHAQYMASTQLIPMSVVLTLPSCAYGSVRPLGVYRVTTLPQWVYLSPLPSMMFLENFHSSRTPSFPRLPSPRMKSSFGLWSLSLAVYLGNTTAGHFPNILTPACLTMKLQVLDIRPDVRVCVCV